jgi:hypothetical protein
MHQIELFEAREIPSTDYGYWIDPAGQYFTVPFQGHDYVIRKLTGMDLDDALDAGWIRVVTDSPTFRANNFVCDIFLGRPRARAIAALRDLIASRDFTRFDVEVGGIPAVNDTEFEYWKKFENSAPFIGYVKRAAAYRPEVSEGEELLEAFELPETNYGYWIKDDGSIIVVPLYGHSDSAYTAGVRAERVDGKIQDVYHVAMRLGWIRLVTKESRATIAVEFEHHRPSVKAFITLKKIATQPGFERFMVDSHDSGEWRQQSKNHKMFHSASAMLSHVSEMRRGPKPPEPLAPPVVEESEELFEGEIPETSYGYWVSPEGEFHVVGNQKHTSVGRELGICPQRQSFAHAYSLGWVRVGSNVKEAPGMLFVEFGSNKLTARAFSAIRRLARSQDFSKFWCHDKSFDLMGAFLNAVRERGQKPFVREPVVEGVEIPASEYGYWIDPDGKLYPVPYQQHYPTITRLIGVGNWDAMDKGWIRVVSHDRTNPTELSVQFTARCVRARAISTLRALAKSASHNTYVADVRGEHARDFGYGKVFDELENFIGYVRLASRPLDKREAAAASVEAIRNMNIFEAEVPLTSYGYWITPDGTIEPVPNMSHLPWLQNNTRFNTYMEAFNAGWIRVVSKGMDDVPTISVNLLAQSVPARAFNSLARVTNSDEFHNFRLDTLKKEYGRGLDAPTETKCFNSAGSFMAAARLAGRPARPED